MMIDDRSSVSSATREMREAVVPGDSTPVVFDYVRPRGPDGIRFDVWYCNEHVPALTAAYAIPRLRRYAAPSRAAYVAIGELEAMPGGAAGHPSTNALPESVEHHERFIGEPLATLRRRDVGEDVLETAVVYPAFLRAPHDRLPELGRWYDEEHLPMLLSCPQWVMARRFRITAARGTDFTHAALHYLTDLRALQSRSRDAARDTPWRDKLIGEGWFAPEYRVCYRLQDF